MSDFGIIYKVTNLINNKIYIGQTTGSLEKRKIKHISCAKLNSNIYFHKALNKYGIGSFDWEILEN